MTASAASFVLNLLFLLGIVADGWLGIYLADTEHPQVQEVVTGSPAEKAGLQPGDRILAVDDQATDKTEAFRDLIRSKKPGQRVRLKLLRNGSEMIVLVKLGERPAEDETPAPAEQRGERPPAPQGEAPAVPGKPRLGVEIVESGEGLSVRSVVPDGPAAKAGIREGDRIVRLGDHEVRTFADLEKVIAARKPGEKLAVQVRSGDGTRSVMVELGAAGGALAVEPKSAPVAVAEAQGGLPFGEDLGAAFEKALKNGRPVLAVFGAAWNNQSQAQRKALQDESLRSLLRRCERVYVDTDRHGGLAQEHAVQELPALLVFHQGKLLQRTSGYLPPERVREFLARALAAGGGEAVSTPLRPSAGAPTAADVEQIRAELAAIKAELAEIRKMLREKR